MQKHSFAKFVKMTQELLKVMEKLGGIESNIKTFNCEIKKLRKSTGEIGITLTKVDTGFTNHLRHHRGFITWILGITTIVIATIIIKFIY